MLHRQRATHWVSRASRAIACGVALAAAIWSAKPLWGRAQQAPQKLPPPPATRVDDVTDDYFGTKVVDPYRWLEDQQSPETRKWIDEQNAYTDSLLNHLLGREALEKRLTALLKVDSISLPVARQGRYFYTKRLADQDQAVLYMRKGLERPEEVLVDPNPLSPDHTATVHLQGVARDGTLIVYGIRQGGEDEITPHALDVDSRRELPDRFPCARYSSISIRPDKTGFYYAEVTPEGSRIYFHKFGTDVSSDAELFGKGYDKNQLIGCSLSEDGRYLLIQVQYGAAAVRSEIYMKDVTRDSPITPIVNDLPARFSGTIAGDHAFLVTNWNAPDGRVVSVDLNDPARDHWRTVVPNSNAVIEGVAPVGGRLAVLYTQDASSRVKIFDPNGKLDQDLALPGIGSVAGFSGRWSSEEAFYGFQSFNRPLTIYRYDLAKNAQQVWARIRVPFDSENYEVKQVWYASKDGTRVPMFVVHAKGLKMDGSNPTLLTGYGGFNLSEQPTFSTLAAAWISGGGVFALANLRGGSEFGEAWHHAGMLANKQNVFDDFIAAAEWLIANRYTSPAKLAIIGTSNGGLLMGAALTQRPDLFRAVICGYPLLDMLRYEKFLVARWWVPEYGTAENPEQFKYIYAYSPYQHFRKGVKYPAVLFLTGDSDTRVAPLHARKTTALVQAATASGYPVLLHYDTKAGHSGGAPVSKQVQDFARELSFLYWQLGVLIH